MPEPEVTVRTTEAGRVTEVVVPGNQWDQIYLAQMISAQVPRAMFMWKTEPPYAIGIRQPGGPDVVALAGERLRIAAGRVERVQ